jgi:protein-tyrosine phosphatase
MIGDDIPNLLFVCSRNRKRSLTAEHLRRGSTRCRVRSVGTEPSARVQVRAADIEWADIVYVMEHSHVNRMRDRGLRDELRGKHVVCLDVPDEYEYMDDDLVEILQAALPSFFD